MGGICVCLLFLGLGMFLLFTTNSTDSQALAPTPPASPTDDSSVPAAPDSDGEYEKVELSGFCESCQAAWHPIPGPSRMDKFVLFPSFPGSGSSMMRDLLRAGSRLDLGSVFSSKHKYA
jgi:hypothetical protein